ncbi:MAG: D-alanyl-D-alanine carboxypeptidase/D-alanyl-D-alanine-endopeptidase [Bacteroidetes bacterium]|nr:D-alanyl-D-alanine carboxypeptidase/D-alanyl-D-alanine-endopeptidase [Bacteroidota bacterium]
MNRKQVIALIVVFVAIIVLTSAFYLYFLFPSQPTIKAVPDRKISLFPKKREKVVNPPTLDSLLIAIKNLAEGDSMRHGNFGFYLASLDSGNVLAEYNSELSLVPASVLKTVTTGVALAKLGPGFTYTTRLQYDGTIDKAKKTLNGNIYIKGMGDPSLGSPVFYEKGEKDVLARWLAAIKSLGVDTINGSIIGDDSEVDNDPISVGWAWEDIQSDYGVGPSGLSFRENLFDVYLTGGSPHFKVDPAVPQLKLYNKVAGSVGPIKNYAYVTGGPYLNEKVILGEVEKGAEFKIQSAVPDAPLFCAFNLFNTLRENKIIIRDSINTIRVLNNNDKKLLLPRTTINTIYSPALASLVYHTNHVSQNFYAESILRTMSLMEHGYGSTAGGTNVVYKYFTGKDIRLGGFYMVDGSGLSRFDGICTRQLAQMLRVFAMDSTVFPAFYNSLPIAGQSGTLSSICKGTCAEKNIRAKSGYMTRVRSYAGYVTTKGNQKLVFAMIANNHGYDVMGMRGKLEELMVKMAELE